MLNLRDADGALVVRDIDVRPPAALKQAVLDCFPTAIVAAAGPATVYFGLGRSLMKVPFERFGRDDFWIDAAEAEVLSARSTGPSTVEVLRAAYGGTDNDDYAPVLEGPLAYKHVPRKPWDPAPVLVLSADDYCPFPADPWAKPAPVKAAAGDPGDDDFAPFTLDPWKPLGSKR